MSMQMQCLFFISNNNFLFPRCIPAFWNSLAPASPTQSIKVEEEKEEDTEKEHGIVFFTLHLREIFISPPKKNPANQPFPSVVDLSPTVFRDQTLQENWNLPRRRWLEALLPFLKGRFKTSSQLVQIKLSLVKTIYPIPRCLLNSPKMRDKALSKKYEKLVVSRPEDSSYFCTKLTEIWLSGGFLTHNSCAMMHKRQLWSKFKI